MKAQSQTLRSYSIFSMRQPRLSITTQHSGYTAFVLPCQWQCASCIRILTALKLNHATNEFKETEGVLYTVYVVCSSLGFLVVLQTGN